VLGLAGVDKKARLRISTKLAESRPVPPLPGVDLSKVIEDTLSGRGDTTVKEPDGAPRKGVLFITDDEITAPLPPSRTAQEKHSYEEFAVYQAVVASVITGKDGKGPVADLSPGEVKQPNHVRCVRTADYKLTRYFDPSGKKPQEWEMYDLKNDPNERINLVRTKSNPPKALDAALQPTVDELAKLLAYLEKRDL